MNAKESKTKVGAGMLAEHHPMSTQISARRILSSLSFLSICLLALVLTNANEAHAAAPVHQANSAIIASTGADVTVVLPAHLTNDIMLLQVVVRDVNDTITWPTGWTQIGTVDRGTTARYWWAWKRAASAAETNPLVNKNTATGDTYAAVTTYRGATTVGDPWEVKGTPTTSTAAAHAITGITTLSAESLVVASLCAETDNAASASYVGTNPAALTAELYVESTTGADGACAVGAAARAAAGATGTVTATWSADPNGSGGILFALKPLPGVVSIDRTSTDPTLSNTAVSWTVVFNRSVTGVDTADFQLVSAGGVTGASISSVTGSGTTWTVNATTGTGTAGTLGLDLVDNDTILDANSERLGGTGAANGNFTGQIYTLAPTVLSINRASTNPTSAGTSVSWTVTFSASVTAVDTADFALVQAGGVTGASISSVSGSGATWTVTANTGTGAAGTLGLNLVDNNTIIDAGSRPLGGAGAGNGNFTGQVYTLVLSVLSINRAGANPGENGVPVSWTVVFSASVTGVDATDFSLVATGGTTGASITSVTGSGTTWTVTANSTPSATAGTLGLNLVDNDSIVSGASTLGGAGAGNGDFTGQVYSLSISFCLQPSNIPAGVTVECVCDRFGRASLNPSTIYGASWVVSVSPQDPSGTLPYIHATSGFLRLTEDPTLPVPPNPSGANNAKAATVPGIFPAAGNYISVEFQHYAYKGSGADGIAVTLSDYSVPAVPGAFGGSLGYAPKNAASCGGAAGCPGFAGGWVGVAIDEFGNFQNPTEGRTGGPGSRPDSIGVRGSGSGLTGYPWVAGTNTLAVGIDNTASTTPAPGHYYQVIVDARNASNPTPETFISVGRDTSGTGTSYTNLVPSFNMFTANPSQSPVPTNWQISFTGSTGGSTNIHEIGGLRICAQSVAPPTGGTASGFSAIDEAYPAAPTIPAYQNFQTGHIYTKLQGNSFRLWVAALTGTGISTAYSAVTAKHVSMKFVDNTTGVCGTDAARVCDSSCTGAAAVEGLNQVVTFAVGGPGASLTPAMTLNSAWKNLVAVMRECTTSLCNAFTATTPACSVDSFSVRPTAITSVTSSNATNLMTTGTPMFKAGSDTFTLTATTAGVAGNASGYNGALKVWTSATVTPSGLAVIAPATARGVVSPGTFPAATSGTGSATSTGNTFRYSEVGAFQFIGADPNSSSTTPRGVYDGVWGATECTGTVAACDSLRSTTSWTGTDSITSKGDCVQNSFSNTKDLSGKYGCLFGITSNSTGFGRFAPHHFDTEIVAPGCAAGGFTYSGQPVQIRVRAENATGGTTLNYDTDTGFSKVVTLANGGTFAGGSFSGQFPATGFQDGVQLRNDIAYAFTAKETGPITGVAGLIVRASDADTSSSTGSEATTEVRSGRVAIQNVFGSELISQTMPVPVQYYHATEGWVTNTIDTCTALAGTITVSNAIGSTSVPGSIIIKSPSNSSSVTLGGVGPSFTLGFTAPNGDGYADATANLSALPWLRFDWDGVVGDDDPRGRATFGIYRGSPRHIYLRERY